MAEVQTNASRGPSPTNTINASTTMSVARATQDEAPARNQTPTPAHTSARSFLTQAAAAAETSSSLLTSSLTVQIDPAVEASTGSFTSSNKTTSSSTTSQPNVVNKATARISHCPDPSECLSLASILQSFNVAVSEDQAWALIHQSVLLYRDARRDSVQQDSSSDANYILVPTTSNTLCLHKDGSVHIDTSQASAREHLSNVCSQRKILFHLGNIIYRALDTSSDTGVEVGLSTELEEIIKLMAFEDDEGIENDPEDDETPGNTKHFDLVLSKCSERIQPNPRNHYRAVCRALATECRDLRTFLQKMFRGDAEQLRNKADVDSTSKCELQKLGFSDWTRFWVQVVAELRKGVRLKKHNYSRPSQVFELTPFEILMEDIRSRNFELRKVIVNGDVPGVVKNDAHAVILEFIRSRPPLRKASERKLAPLRSSPTPRESLLESIRQGQTLKHIDPPKEPDIIRIADPPLISNGDGKAQSTQRRLIHVDMSMFDDDDDVWSTDDMNTKHEPSAMDTSFSDVVHRRKKDSSNFTNQPTKSAEDLQSIIRRHTIVGCHNDPPSPSLSRPESRQSQVSNNNTTTTITTINPLNPLNSMTSEALAEWNESPNDSLDDELMMDVQEIATMADVPETSDRLALSLEEIVHIRSVMTKAELEGLPVGVHVKEDVERKKVCFLCLRTRFSMFREWGVQCKLCQRTVCSKCYTKMRIPTEHFRNVPVMLLSASLMGSPVSASPLHSTSATIRPSDLDDSLRSEPNIKTHHHHNHHHHYHHHHHHHNQHVIGSAPTTPRRYISHTPGSYTNGHQHNHPSMTMSTSGLPLSISRILDAHSDSIVDGMDPNQSLNGEDIMSRSMDGGPRSLPPQSPATARSHPNTLDRQNRFARAFSRSGSQTNGISDSQKDLQRGEIASVCNDCRDLVNEIIRSSKQTRSSARNKALRNMTLDLSPVYKGGW